METLNFVRLERHMAPSVPPRVADQSLVLADGSPTHWRFPWPPQTHSGRNGSRRRMDLQRRHQSSSRSSQVSGECILGAETKRSRACSSHARKARVRLSSPIPAGRLKAFRVSLRSTSSWQAHKSLLNQCTSVSTEKWRAHKVPSGCGSC